MATRDDVASLLKDVEGLKARAEAAEAKVKEAEAAKETAEKEAEATKTKALNLPTAGHSYSSDETRALRAFGVTNVKDLLQVNTAAPQYKGVNAELKHLVRDLKKTVDVARFTAQMFHGAPLDHVGADPKSDRVAFIKNLAETYYGRTELAPRLKAFGSTVAGYGDEFVPTLISSAYIQEFELELGLQARFREIKMPSSPYDLPVVKDVLKAQKVAEGAAAGAREFGTDKLRFTASKIESYHVVPEELNEDSAPDFLSIARQELVMSHDRAVESAILNGDNDGSHPDSDTQAGSALLAEKLWKGLRALALANSANGGTKNIAGALSTTVLLQMRAQMKKFGVNPADLVWIVGPAVYAQLMGLPEILTVDKAGPMAAQILKGSLASILGIPVVVSQHMREDLNASGVYDGTTTTKGGIVLVNAARYYVGMRRAPQLRIIQDLPNYDRYLMAAYQRLDFQGHAQSASEASVCYGYNITL
jgi:HK97 family phage major capsid protein